MKHHFKKTSPFVSNRLLIATLFLAFTVCTANINAQSYTLKQAIILNDGNRLYNLNGSYVTVGSYNPLTKTYQTFDTIHADFGSYVIIDSGYIYVGADTLLVKYDLSTKARLATQTVKGIREMAVWGNQILVTRAATYHLHSYFQAYNKNTLQLVYEDTTISYATEGIKVLNDSAYLAINDFGSGLVGKLGVIDLKAHKEKHEVDLGPNGLNPYTVAVEKTNQKIYTVNDLNWSNSSVTQFNANTNALSCTSLNLTSGCTGSTYYASNIYFQASNANNIGEYSTNSQSVWDSLKIKKDIYGIAVDSADGNIFVGQTDYVTYGNVFIYNLYGQAVDSFAVNVGPGNFAFDITLATGIPQNKSALNLQVYPNPADNELHINFTDSQKETATLYLFDVLGRPVYQSTISTNAPATISLLNVPSGVYFLKVQTPGAETVKKIIKE